MFLIYPEILIDILGYDLKTLLKKFFAVEGIQFSFTDRTLNNILSGKHTPSKNNEAELKSKFTYIFDKYYEKKITSFDSYIESFIDKYPIDYGLKWGVGIENLRMAGGKDFFPITQEIILKLEQLDIHLKEELNRLGDKEDNESVTKIIQDNILIKKFVSKKEVIQTHIPQISIPACFNTTLYLLACLESEFIVFNEDIDCKHSRIAKFLLPQKKNDEIRLPIARFFDYISIISKQQSPHSPHSMIKYISLLSEKKDTLERSLSKKRKFYSWTAGKHKPKIIEIKNIIKGVFKDIDDWNLDFAINIYYISFFLTNLFKRLQEINVNNHFWKSDDDLINFFYNYETFYKTLEEDMSNIKAGKKTCLDIF